MRLLIESGRVDDARRWAAEGIAQTKATLPGIAHQLEELVCKLAEQDRDWPRVAAFHAEEFLKHPSVGGLETFGLADRTSSTW